MGEDSNGWSEWGKHVLASLESLDEDIHRLEDRVIKLCVDIEGLKARTSREAKLWGAVGGAIPVAIGLLIWLLKGVGS